MTCLEHFCSLFFLWWVYYLSVSGSFSENFFICASWHPEYILHHSPVPHLFCFGLDAHVQVSEYANPNIRLYMCHKMCTLSIFQPCCGAHSLKLSCPCCLGLTLCISLILPFMHFTFSGDTWILAVLRYFLENFHIFVSNHFIVQICRFSKQFFCC